MRSEKNGPEGSVLCTPYLTRTQGNAKGKKSVGEVNT